MMEGLSQWCGSSSFSFDFEEKMCFFNWFIFRYNFYFFWQAEATCYFLLYCRISHIKNVLKFKVSSGQNFCYPLPIRNIGCCGFYSNCELATAAAPPQSFFVLLYDVCIGLPKSVILRHMNIPKSPCYRDKESVRIHKNISWKSARICKHPYPHWPPCIIGVTVSLKMCLRIPVQ